MYVKSLILLSSAACMTLASCGIIGNYSAHGEYAFRRAESGTDPTRNVNAGHWDVPAGLDGPRKIVVDTTLQKASYYISGRLVGTSTVSSGKAGHGTPKGTFRVLAKDEDHISSTYGSIVDAAGNTLVGDYKRGQHIPAGGRYQGAPMNFGMQLTSGGIWMHEGFVTAAPESHGCIRLPREMAKIFFENTPVGTPVIIK